MRYKHVLVDEIEKLSEQIDMLKKKAFDLDSQKAMHETTIQVEDLKNSELRNEMYQLDREINKLQEQYAKLSEESRMLETRKIEMDEKRKYALEYASNAEKAKELKAMMEEAHYEYELLQQPEQRPGHAVLLVGARHQPRRRLGLRRGVPTSHSSAMT